MSIPGMHGFVRSIVLCFILPIVCSAQGEGPRVYSMDPATLFSVRNDVASKTSVKKEAYKKLLRDAEKAMTEGPWSVMEKSEAPPGGTKHDYMSYSRYWWPDPSKPNGLPYIQRDGETNPEIESITDNKYMDNLTKNATTLALAFYFTRDEKYAEKTTTLLRTWFLDSATRMNPNLNFSQMVKGKEGGRPSGMLDMRGLAKIVDVIGLLAGSQSWTANDQNGMHDWVEKYFTWLNESPISHKEFEATNNHGVWFDVQQTAIALFLGKKDYAVKVIEEAKARRIAQQIEPDGTQPRELARTRSLHYTFYNLEAFFSLATIAGRAGVDLWNYTTTDGRSIRKALDYTIPYITDEKKWDHQQIDEFKTERLYPLFLTASAKYNDDRYAKLAEKFAAIDAAKKDRIHLLIP